MGKCIGLLCFAQLAILPCWRGLPGGNIALAAPPVLATGEKRAEFLWSLTVTGRFEEVLSDIRTAAASRNFPVTNERDYKSVFEERLRQLGKESAQGILFEHYVLLEFCNVMVALEALNADLRMGVFLPCRMAVFQKKGSGAVTLLTVNPRFYPKILGNPALHGLADKVEPVIREIFNTVAE